MSITTENTLTPLGLQLFLKELKRDLGKATELLGSFEEPDPFASDHELESARFANGQLRDEILDLLEKYTTLIENPLDRIEEGFREAEKSIRKYADT